jgi:hypothetical protein
VAISIRAENEQIGTDSLESVPIPSKAERLLLRDPVGEPAEHADPAFAVRLGHLRATSKSAVNDRQSRSSCSRVDIESHRRHLEPIPAR